MTYHVCLKCGNVWFGGWGRETEHDGCYLCLPMNDKEDPEVPSAESGAGGAR